MPEYPELGRESFTVETIRAHDTTLVTVKDARFLAFEKDDHWELRYNSRQNGEWHTLGGHEGDGIYRDRYGAEAAILQNVIGDIAVIGGFCGDGGG
jgi:hypothetical protein